MPEQRDEQEPHAVKTTGMKRFHILKPYAPLGTYLCGVGTRPGEATWTPISQVAESRRCKTCWRRYRPGKEAGR